MTYVIGDVHGEYDTLMDLMELILANSHVIFVGDLIDRGFKSAQVIKFIRQNNYECVLGNHDETFIYNGKKDLDSKFKFLIDDYKNGFESYLLRTYASYGFIKFEDKVIEILPYSMCQSVLYEREESYDERFFNIIGHTPHETPIINKYFTNIDTTCCYGYNLSAYCVQTGQILSVKKIDSQI